MTHWNEGISESFDIVGNTFTCKICQFVVSKKTKAMYHFKSKHDPLIGKHRECYTAWHSLVSADRTCSLCGYRFRPKNEGEKYLFDALYKHLDKRHPGKRQEVISIAVDKAKAENAAAVQLKLLADETANRRRAQNVKRYRSKKFKLQEVTSGVSDTPNNKAENVAALQLNVCESSTERSQIGQYFPSITANMSLFTVDGNTFTCKICQSVCTLRSSAVKHFRVEHVAILKKYRKSRRAWHSLLNTEGTIGLCSLCDYKYTPYQGKDRMISFHYFREHLDLHHPGKRREVVSAALDQVYKEAETANDDDNDSESAYRVYASVPKEGYVCGDCDLSFPTVQERLQHRNDAHPIAQTLPSCSECGKVFSTYYELRRHRNNHRFECRHCSFTCYSNAAKKAHMLQCSQRPHHLFRCPLCGKPFDAERLLKAHLAMKHQPTQLGELLHTVEIVKEPSRKRLIVGKVQQPLDCVKPKQDSDARGLNEMISFAIVKNEDYFEDTSGNSDEPPLRKVKHEEDTTGELSEMTFSAITCKQECDM